MNNVGGHSFPLIKYSKVMYFLTLVEEINNRGSGEIITNAQRGYTLFPPTPQFLYIYINRTGLAHKQRMELSA